MNQTALAGAALGGGHPALLDLRKTGLPKHDASGVDAATGDMEFAAPLIEQPERCRLAGGDAFGGQATDRCRPALVST